MAFSAPKPVALARPVGGLLALEAFRARSAENPDGWGMALWEGRGARIFKEPVSAEKSALYGYLAGMEGLLSPVWLVHVRETSVGGNTSDNTHPFVREWMGREYAFAHNGTLKDYPRHELGPRFHAAGATDSEWAFCRLMGRMTGSHYSDGAAGGGKKPSDRMTGSHKSVAAPGGRNQATEGITEAFPRLPCGESFMEAEGAAERFEALCREIDGWGRFNALFSDGRTLWVYRDLEGYKGLSWRPTEAGTLIASTPLDGGPWAPLEPGRLAQFRDGEKIGG